MAYKFRLQRILDLKFRQEEDKKAQIAEVMKQIQDKKQEREGLEAERNQKARQMENIVAEGALIQELQNLSRYDYYLSQCIFSIKKELEYLEKVLEQRKEEYMQARKERKSYENLREKDIEKYYYREKKEEEKMIDQIVTFQKRSSL